jgi:hypothetical protein
VFARAGQVFPGGATTAPPLIQVAALSDTFTLVVFLILGALLLATWGLIQERRGRGVVEPAPRSEA